LYPKNQIIKPGDIKAIDDEGMPMHKNPFVKGKLFVRFEVEFPAPGSLDASACASLAKALPAPPKIPAFKDDEEHEEVTMHAADIENMGKGQGGRQDDDDDDERGGQRVQCAQQ